MLYINLSVLCVHSSGFVQKQSLLRHERIHSGYKPYKCRLCDRPFTDSATVRKHMILVHKKDPHNWQGDVISDLKRPREFWPEDWEQDPKNPKAQDYSGKSHQSDNGDDMSTHTNTGGNSAMYNPNPASLSVGPMPDSQRQYHTDVNMMDRAEPLSLVQHSAPVSMHMMSHQPPPISSMSSPMGHMSHHDHQMSGHHSPPNSAVEIAAASILNLSAQLPPLPAPMSHLSPVPMEGQMPSILNLSTMHNMSYNHHGTN